MQKCHSSKNLVAEGVEVDEEQDSDPTTLHAMHSSAMSPNSSNNMVEERHVTMKRDEVLDESDSEDEDAGLNHISNMKQGGGSNRSLRRYDEYASFLSRSERALSQPDPMPSPEELQKREVQFHQRGSLTSIHELEPWSKDDHKHLFMQSEDFARIDRDSEITSFRWNNHQAGKIEFDTENNTIRGLEAVLMKDEGRFKTIAEHQANVLMEIHNQKVAGRSLAQVDWDKVRQVARRISASQEEQAAKVGKLDEEECLCAWDPSRRPVKAAPKPVEDGKKKKKGGLFGLFGKKK